MESPEKEEVEKFDKLIVQQVKQEEIMRDLSYSALKKIDDKQVAPIAMI